VRAAMLPPSIALETFWFVALSGWMALSRLMRDTMRRNAVGLNPPFQNKSPQALIHDFSHKCVCVSWVVLGMNQWEISVNAVAHRL
jgi:hypothetical protein